MRNQWMITAGIITATGCVATVYLALKKKKEDRLAAEFIKVLTRELQPATAGLLSENAFDIGYKSEVIRKSGRTILTLKDEVAGKYAQGIHNAWGSWWSGGDDEDKVYSVFRSLKDKVQVSQIANAYLKRYQINLIDQLNNRLDKGEIEKVLKIIQPLPAFRTV